MVDRSAILVISYYRSRQISLSMFDFQISVNVTVLELYIYDKAVQKCIFKSVRSSRILKSQQYIKSTYNKSESHEF